MWKDVEERMPAEFKNYEKKLKSLCLASRAPGTVRTYSYAFKRWRDWTSSHNLNSLPANPVELSVFLTYTIEEKRSYHSVRTLLYAIDWAHKLAGFEPPSKHPLVKSVFDAAHRQLGTQTVKKEPISAELLSLMVKSLSQKQCLYNARTIAICLLAYSGFLRYDEVSRLKCCDVVINSDYMLLFIESSKTDKYRDGAWLPISRTFNPTCPVSNLENYARLGDIKFSGNEILFRDLTNKRGKTVFKRSPLSYSRVRELVKEAFEGFIDTKIIGTHSLRAGGATAAANAGVPDRIFKRHGRWLSDRAKDGYIKDDIQKRLSVSRSLGI